MLFLASSDTMCELIVRSDSMNDVLSWLLAGHMLGDFIFQTNWMAERKTKEYSPLFIHCAIYACSIWFSSLPVPHPVEIDSFRLIPWGLSPLSVLFVFISHAVIDRRKITIWWCRNVTRSDKMWLLIMTDQSLHVIILAITCLLERSI